MSDLLTTPCAHCQKTPQVHYLSARRMKCQDGTMSPNLGAQVVVAVRLALGMSVSASLREEAARQELGSRYPITDMHRKAAQE